MTKKELLEMAKKLQSEAEAMPDEGGDNPSTTSSEAGTEETENSETTSDENTEQEETNSNDEVEEKKQIEPQTNGKITDEVQPGHDTDFQQSTAATETVGVEQVLAANFDKRFATMLEQYTALAAEVDKMKVVLSEILTRIELVQEVTDKVTTVDHDSLLSESIKLLI